MDPNEMDRSEISRAEILARFERLLDSALAAEDPPSGIPPELLFPEDDAEGEPGGSFTDWHTVWSALTALTQEIKLQGRAFKQLSESLAAPLAAEAEQRGRKESLGALLEMRERLSRGIEGLSSPDAASLREQLQPSLLDRIFTQRWKQLQHALSVVNALEDGYRLSLGYLDDLLVQYNLHPIDSLGQPFDPRRMNAVDVEETDRSPEGTVLFVYRAGYEWNGVLYRPAQVRVARRAALPSTPAPAPAATAPNSSPIPIESGNRHE